MFQKYIYTVNFSLHEDDTVYKAWHEAMEAKGRSEIIKRFNLLCDDRKYTKNTEDFNLFVIKEFRHELSTNGLSDKVKDKIKAWSFKEIDESYICCVDHFSDYDNSVFRTEREALKHCQQFDECWVFSEKLLPPDKYFIGDPNYVLKDPYMYILNVQPDRGIFTNEGGLTFAKFRTYFGDGIFEDDDGDQYPVDSGCIAVLPMSICDEQQAEKHLGAIINMESPFPAEWEPDDGVEGDIVIANSIVIHTNPGWNDD